MRYIFIFLLTTILTVLTVIIDFLVIVLLLISCSSGIKEYYWRDVEKNGLLTLTEILWKTVKY